MSVDTLPGNKIGPTYQGLRDRLRKEDDPNYAIENSKDLSNDGAWQYWVSHPDPDTGMYDMTWRIAIVPVIQDPPPEDLDNGKTNVPVTGMAGFFIERVYDGKDGIHDKGDVEGHFIQGIKFGEEVRWMFPADPDPQSTQLILAIRLLS